MLKDASDERLRYRVTQLLKPENLLTTRANLGYTTTLVLDNNLETVYIDNLGYTATLALDNNLETAYTDNLS